LTEGFICMEEVTICNGAEIAVGPLSADRTYEWSPANPDLTDPLNPVFSPTETTVYTVVATDANGARSTGTVTVNVVEGFDLAIMDVDDVECSDSVNLTAVSNRDDLVYEWSTSDQFTDSQMGNPITFPLMTGTNSFYVKGTSPEGCEEVALILIESSKLDLSVENSSDTNPYNACSDESATVSVINIASDQNVTVVWEPSDNITSDLNQNEVSVVAIGDEELITITYTATNEQGCSETESVDIPVSRSIDASITGMTISCDGVFNVLANSDADDAEFEWSYSSDFDPVISTDPNLTVELDEPQTIFLRANVGEVCQSDIISQDLTFGTFDVSFTDGEGNSLPSEICVGDELKINGSSDDPTVSIVYGPSDNIIENAGGNMVTVAAISGQSELVIPYVATNEPGCEVSGEIVIAIGSVEEPVLTVMNIDCATGDVMFKSGQPDGSVLWDFGDGNTSTDGDPTHRYESSGSYVVTLSSNTPYCMFDTQVTDPPLEIPDFISLQPVSPEDPSQTIEYCEGDAVTLAVAVTGNATLEWQGGDGNVLGSGTELTFNPDGMIGMVRVVATADDERCGTSMIEYTLEEYVFSIDKSDVPPAMCPGEEVILSVTDNTGANIEYSWSPSNIIVGDANSSMVTVAPDVSTDVTVLITNIDNGCTKEEVFSVMVHPVSDLTAIADPDPEIFLCEEVILSAEGNFDSFVWSNGVTGRTQSVEPTETTTYTVTATDENGCTKESSVTINVTTPECDLNTIFVPDAFSPNGDGANDLLLVRSNAVKEMDFFIVDRWGNEVFRTTDQRVGWNGQFNNDGRELHPDAYAWCLFVRCSNGEERHFTGNVSLIR